MNLTFPVLNGAAHVAELPGNSVASLLQIADDSPDGTLTMVMSGLSGVAAALAVAIVLTVYFRCGYRSGRDVLRHGLAAAVVLALLGFVAYDMRHAALAYLGINLSPPLYSAGAQKDHCMPEFRLTQISDTHLARRHPQLTDNFHRVSEHIDATRPDLVVNSGDLAWDAPTNPDDYVYARELHAALPAPCRHIPGNHDVGDNPNLVGPAPSDLVTEQSRQQFLAHFGEDRWRFEAAGWCFIGLNSLLMNTGLASEAEQFDWLASQLSAAGGKPVAMFLHKPLYRDSPDDAALATSALRYVQKPARSRLMEVLGAADLRLVASGHVHQRRDFTYGHTRHVWAPSTAFIISDRIQEVIGTKEVGLVEYRFQPDSFEVRHVRAPGQVDIDLESLLGRG